MNQYQYPPGYNPAQMPGQPGYAPPQPQFPGMAPQPGAQPQGPGPMPSSPPQGFHQPQQPGWHQQQQPFSSAPQGSGAPQGFQQPPGGARPRTSLAGVRAGNTNGRYLPVGEYVLEVNRCLVTTSMDGRGDYFVVEFTVIESDNAAVMVGDNTYSWARAFEDQYGYGKRDIKGWLCDLVETKLPGSNPREQWDDGFVGWAAQEGDAATNHPQPARGSRWRVSAFDKPNKRKAGSTTIMSWSPMAPSATAGLVPTHATAARAPTPHAQPPSYQPGQQPVAYAAQQAPQYATAWQGNPQGQPQGVPPGFQPPPGMAPGVWPGQGGQGR